MNIHAPLKSMKVMTQSLLYTNKEQTSAICKEKNVTQKIKANKIAFNSENFRKSPCKYLIERCIGGCRPTQLWPTVNPFLINKGCYKLKNTI